MWTIDCYPIEHDDDSIPESIANTKNWLNLFGDLDHPNDSQHDCPANIETDI